MNSLHHQAVERVGPGQRAIAWSPDGVIEAIEMGDPSRTWEIGVQWHPEKMPEATSDRLFEAFVLTCRERSNEAT